MPEDIKPGKESSEHGVTWLAMLVAALSIVAQIAGQMFMGIDLGIDIDTALLAMGLPAGVYTVVRGAVKGIAAKNEPEPTPYNV